MSKCAEMNEERKKKNPKLAQFDEAKENKVTAENDEEGCFMYLESEMNMGGTFFPLIYLI